MRKFRFTVGMTMNKLGIESRNVYIVELPDDYTDEQVESEFQGYFDNHLENLCYDPDDITTEAFGGWEEIYE